MGGMMGVRLSFLWQILLSITSVVHGGTGMGVKMPMENGHVPNWPQPVSPSGARRAATTRTQLRTLRIPNSLPLPRVGPQVMNRAPAGAKFAPAHAGAGHWEISE